LLRIGRLCAGGLICSGAVNRWGTSAAITPARLRQPGVLDSSSRSRSSPWRYARRWSHDEGRLSCSTPSTHGGAAGSIVKATGWMISDMGYVLPDSRVHAAHVVHVGESLSRHSVQDTRDIRPHPVWVVARAVKCAGE